MDEENKDDDLGDLGDAFERLRKSKEECDLPQRQQGRKAGIEWAKLKAKYEELRSLSAFIQDVECDIDEMFNHPGINASERIAAALVWPEMWADLADGEELSVWWKIGFCEGANDVFERFADAEAA